MYNCSASFLLSLPAIDARLVRPTSYSLRRIQHSIITSSGRRRRNHLSIHEITIPSSSQACCFSAKETAFLRKFKFNEKPSGKFVTCVSSSLPSEEEEEEVHSSHLGFLENDSAESPRDSDLIQQVSESDLINIGSKGFKQTLTRSNLVAKQVISIQSALSLGFISQLWVDTTSWLVLVVDVKPTLLSGESERFMLTDITRVGDVVLVKDDAVLDTEFKMVGLEILVGYRVVTPGGRNIGKVRGYSFNINSGVVESLELDSFGVTIIPSSLVSTYRLDVEDIIEVLEDIVVVDESAAFRKQRLTKGLWDAQFGSEYSDVEELESSSDRRRRRRSSRPSRRKRDLDDDDDVEWDMFS
ncbi:hypothetical protein BRARA_C01948 [Brassica rapa]|uniref:PRC-barrel domain-containing protein n=1 Tax=Brassica campestris TaxID=3711 RepID=A0A397ZWC8_BRACM|nr:hypothetical protein BRARA_C01948 [Brassica rapa]CAG7880774.1 unnamed protein product [Brassica rapa]VDC80156.1 unnamed protein product [Brassica rapa]